MQSKHANIHKHEQEHAKDLSPVPLVGSGLKHQPAHYPHAKIISEQCSWWSDSTGALQTSWQKAFIFKLWFFQTFQTLSSERQFFDHDICKCLSLFTCQSGLCISLFPGVIFPVRAAHGPCPTPQCWCENTTIRCSQDTKHDRSRLWVGKQRWLRHDRTVLAMTAGDWVDLERKPSSS